MTQEISDYPQQPKRFRKKIGSIIVYRDTIFDLCQHILQQSMSLDIYVFDRHLFLVRGDDVKLKLFEFMKIMPITDLYLDVRSDMVRILVTGRVAIVESLGNSVEAKILAEDCNALLRRCEVSLANLCAQGLLRVLILMTLTLLVITIWTKPYGQVLSDEVKIIISFVSLGCYAIIAEKWYFTWFNQIHFAGREEADMLYRTRDAVFTNLLTAIFAALLGFILGIYSSSLLAEWIPPK